MNKFDCVIIGGGIFGVYSALYLANKNLSVCLIEKENQLLSKASIVNQCRLHSGYHYPRSMSTAKMATEYKERFFSEHKQYINTTFDSYYAIEKNSYTGKDQFERFCIYLGLPLKPIKDHSIIQYDSLDALYLTSEYSFDAVQLADHYRKKIISTHNITILLNSVVCHVSAKTHEWNITYKSEGVLEQMVSAASVINASYAGTNAVNSQFGLYPLPLEYELSEIVLIRAPSLTMTGLTVLDGPFVSTLPYGNTGLHTLSSVWYTHHHATNSPYPQFDCQKKNPYCSPEAISICSSCLAKPNSNQNKMIQQLKKYMSPDIHIEYLHSNYTIKTKLKSSYLDDGRPTEISKLMEDPPFYCLLSGKINSLYEIEKLMSNEF